MSHGHRKSCRQVTIGDADVANGVRQAVLPLVVGGNGRCSRNRCLVDHGVSDARSPGKVILCDGETAWGSALLRALDSLLPWTVLTVELCPMALLSLLLLPSSVAHAMGPR